MPTDKERAKKAEYKRAYYAAFPEKKARHRELNRELMRKKRADPEYRIQERVRRELALMKREENGRVSGVAALD